MGKHQASLSRHLLSSREQGQVCEISFGIKYLRGPFTSINLNKLSIYDDSISIFISLSKGRNIENLFDVSHLQNPRGILEKGVKYSTSALQSEAFQEILSNLEEEYDAVITEWYYNGLLAP